MSQSVGFQSFEPMMMMMMMMMMKMMVMMNIDIWRFQFDKYRFLYFEARKMTSRKWSMSDLGFLDPFNGTQFHYISPLSSRNSEINPTFAAASFILQQLQ